MAWEYRTATDGKKLAYNAENGFRAIADTDAELAKKVRIHDIGAELSAKLQAMPRHWHRRPRPCDRYQTKSQKEVAREKAEFMAIWEAAK